MVKSVQTVVVFTTRLHGQDKPDVNIQVAVGALPPYLLRRDTFGKPPLTDV
jgi:hypothetical protein